MAIKVELDNTCDIHGGQVSHLEHALVLAQDRSRPFASENKWVYSCNECWGAVTRMVEAGVKKIKAEWEAKHKGESK